MKDILDYSDEPIVSIDQNGDPTLGHADAPLTDRHRQADW